MISLKWSNGQSKLFLDKVQKQSILDGIKNGKILKNNDTLA